MASHAQKHFLRVSGNTKRRSKFAAVDALASQLQNQPVGELKERDDGSRAVQEKPRHVSRFANAGRANSAGGVSDGSFEQGMQFGRSVVSIPPVQADGVAVGIPLPELPELTPFDGNRKIPMLKVLPGRIRAMSTVCRPPSPSPSQKKKGDADDHVHDVESRPRLRKRTRFGDVGCGDGGTRLDALAGVAVALALDEEGDAAHAAACNE